MGGRLCIVGASDAFTQGAGARIRYLRLREELARHDWTLSMRSIASFATKNAAFDDDVYLISKVYDHRAVVLAHAARREGRCVGIDLFDDYFSGGDPRLTQRRAWLRATVEQIDFALASTPAIADALRPFLDALPVHLLNDPAVSIDPVSLAARLEAKRARAIARRRLQIGWFGMGDNPYFDVGLHDLVAFADRLAAVERDGWTVRLRVLTNDRALTVDALAALARLPVPYDLELWSETRETAVLAACDASFLPVNAQPFSVVKSLNRAVTALAHGTQVFSAGYPLYDRLGAFIYRDPAALSADIATGNAKLRPDTLPALATLLRDIADAGAEGQRLAAFLDRCTASGGRQPTSRRRLAVLHGRRSEATVHKMAQSRGSLSVATPFTRAKLHYHLRIGYHDGSGRVTLSDRLEGALRPEWLARVSRLTGGDGTVELTVMLTADELAPAAIALEAGAPLRTDELASYAQVMRASASLVAAMLDIDVTVSEGEPGFTAAGPQR